MQSDDALREVRVALVSVAKVRIPIQNLRADVSSTLIAFWDRLRVPSASLANCKVARAIDYPHRLQAIEHRISLALQVKALVKVVPKICGAVSHCQVPELSRCMKVRP